MLLSQYQKLTRRILDDQTFARVNHYDLRDYINIGRGQIAVQGDCLPNYGTLEVAPPTQQYSFSQIQFPPGSGIAGPVALETINWDTPQGGQQPLNAIEWARFNRFEQGHTTPTPSKPRVWTQFGQGGSGTLWVNTLDGPYTLSIKARCYPVDLVDDTTPDALPYLWTDAVPWFAAFYYLSGNGQNPEMAAADLKVFQQFVTMARGGATPDTQPGQFTQGPDLLMNGRLGLSTGAVSHPRQLGPPQMA